LGDTDDADCIGIEYLQRDMAVDILGRSNASVVDEDVEMTLAAGVTPKAVLTEASSASSSWTNCPLSSVAAASPRSTLRAPT
jgi:hypothetical protein